MTTTKKKTKNTCNPSYLILGHYNGAWPEAEGLDMRQRGSYLGVVLVHRTYRSLSRPEAGATTP